MSDRQAISHVWSLFSASPAKHRNLMLQGILTQCCFPQLSFLSTAVIDLIKIDFITALPSEISFKILGHLDTTSLCKAAQVSQRWRLLADDDVVWHKMCEQHVHRKCTKCGWGLPLLEKKQLRDWKREQQLRARARGLNQWSPEPTSVPDNGANDTANHPRHNGATKRDADAFASDGRNSSTTTIAKRPCVNGVKELVKEERATFRPWKLVYKDRYLVSTNWKYGRFKTKVLKGHTNGVMCLQFDDNIVATGSYDCTIKIWDIDTGECLRTLTGHTECVRALQFDDSGKLISGSVDNTLKVWNWRTGECKNTMEGHTAKVIGLHYENSLLASASEDKSVIVWNIKTATKFCLKGHEDWVNSVRLDTASNTLFSASDDMTVRLWDLDTKRTIQIFSGHVAPVQQVLLLPEDYEPEEQDPDEDDDSSSRNSRSPSPYPDLYAHWPSNRPRPPRYILTSSLDATIRLWCVETGRCLKKFFGHVEGVWGIAADTLRIVSCAQDRMVKVWDARTGKCDRTITGHEGPVTCIGLSDSTLVTGSEDHMVRVLSFAAENPPNY